MCETERIHQISKSTSKPCFTQFVKRRLKKGGHGHPRAPPPSYALKRGPREAETNQVFGSPSLTITAQERGTVEVPSFPAWFCLRWCLIFLYRSTVFILICFSFPFEQPINSWQTLKYQRIFCCSITKTKFFIF